MPIPHTNSNNRNKNRANRGALWDLLATWEPSDDDIQTTDNDTDKEILLHIMLTSPLSNAGLSVKLNLMIRIANDAWQ
jgi:hypothetical protein